MYKTKITSQGTISLPAVLRKKYNLLPGQILMIEDTGRLVLSKAPDMGDIRRRNQQALNGKKIAPYRSGDGFAAHVIEKYGKN